MITIFEKIDQTSIKIESLNKKYLVDIKRLWNYQYEKIVKKYKYLPEVWIHTDEFTNFIKNHFQKKTVLFFYIKIKL